MEKIRVRLYNKNTVKFVKGTNEEILTQLWNHIVYNEGNIPKNKPHKTVWENEERKSYVNRCCNTEESVKFRVSVKRIKHHSLSREMFVLSDWKCVVFIAEWKSFAHPVGDTALQRNYKCSTANNYDTYFTGNPLGTQSDIYMPQIFRTKSICGDIIGCPIQRCTTGTDCRDSSNFYLANRCYCW